MQANINLSWLFKMAWRDSKRNIFRILLFTSSIILGIAALVAISSFGNNLQKDIDNQSKELLGADLVITSRQKPNQDIQQLLDSIQNIGKKQAQEIEFFSVVRFPKRDTSLLVAIRALQGDFPFYGSLDVTPKEAFQSFLSQKSALIDESLQLQVNSSLGDVIQIGKTSFKITGILGNIIGENNLISALAPKVYIPLTHLKQTKLIQPGSVVFYHYYFAFEDTYPIQGLTNKIKYRLQKAGFNLQTVESNKALLLNNFEVMTNFLNLVGFIALLLGCIGVASAIQIHIKDKLSTIALLCCLGSTNKQAFLIYLIQIIGMSVIGVVCGTFLGSLVQWVLPFILKDFLVVEVTYRISWRAISQGVFIGLSISLLFALIPLLGIRKIPPLNVLRATSEKNRKDVLEWLLYIIILLSILLFTYWQTQDVQVTLVFTGFITSAFFFLWGMAKVLVWSIRRFFPVSWNYVWRQGLANLYRPYNQTVLLIVSIGLGTGLIATLHFVQSILLNQVQISDTHQQPNIFISGIQPRQIEPVTSLTQATGMEIKQSVPMVPMLLDSFRGRSRVELLNDSTGNIPRDVITREYRVTYRNTLDNNETLVKGQLGSPVTEKQRAIKVSVSQGHAQRMKAQIGDEIVFNVQGIKIKTVIGSIRKLDLGKFQTSFTFVFPTGVLEEAPHFQVLLGRVPDKKVVSDIQQRLAAKFPNVTVFDITLVTHSLEKLLAKIAFVIHFMALFSIITGLVVLAASVAISKYQRIQESVLLRTLGASKKQIMWIAFLEYFFLGSLATIAGILLAWGGSWLLAKYFFEIHFLPSYLPVFFLYGLITGITILIGLWNVRVIVQRSPLEVLREQ